MLTQKKIARVTDRLRRGFDIYGPQYIVLLLSRRLYRLTHNDVFGKLANKIDARVKKQNFIRDVPARDLSFSISLNKEALNQDYQEKGLARMPDTFALYRIIGNDLYPRHQKGQSRANVRFILNNEEEFPACEKWWIVNRIFDHGEELAILDLLKARNQRFVHIPFQFSEYRKVDWDFERFPEPQFFINGVLDNVEATHKTRAELQIRRLKNNYAMNNNGARNLALRHGKRQNAKWILPWDGNCFLTKEAWDEIVSNITEQSYLKYFAVPMARITSNHSLLESNYRPEAREEPQLVFRVDSHEEFDEQFSYGRRPKVELFWRLGVPGPWMTWPDYIWDLPRPELCAEAGQFATAGWVARLSSGQIAQENQNKAAFLERGMARAFAIKSTLDALDEQACRQIFAASNLCTFDPAKINSLIPESLLCQSLLGAAEEALLRGPYSVVDKSTVPPSGNLHDYWHPAPYWWPNPKSKDGLPYVWRDGKRVPGTRLYESASEQYDRTRLQRLFDDTTILALAYQAVGDRRFIEHAARLVRCWFIDSKTRMNPHLKYAQVRLGHRNNQGAHTGVIEMKDFYYFLDAVRLVQQAEVLHESEQTAFREWLEAYVDWLQSSQQGHEERKSPGNHGTCYDLQIAAIAAYLDDVPLLLSTLRDSHERLLAQITPEGKQPYELERTQTQHYCAFNLQSWVNLATLAEKSGQNLWDYEATDGRGLRQGFNYLLPYISGKPWPYPQIEPFDQNRYLPLCQVMKERYGDQINHDFDEIEAQYTPKPIFFPHDGIKPFWMLG